MRMLIIAANFAPRGASPAIRTVNLAKAFWDLGHEVQVLTYSVEDLTAFGVEDEGLSSKVPSAVRVHRIKAGALRRRMLRKKTGSSPRSDGSKRRLLANPLIHLLIPDPHIECAGAFFRQASRLMRDCQPDVFFTFAYPFSMHVVGCLLKRRFPAVRWVADYGDPWSGGAVEELQRPPWRKRFDMMLERRLLRRADLVSVTSDATAALYRSLYPETRARVVVTTMGYDPLDFEDLPRVSPDDGFRRIVHAGRIYGEARDCRPFLHAMRNCWDGREDWIRNTRIAFVGEIDPESMAEIASHPSRELFEFYPWVPYRDSLAWMKQADGLLLIGNKGDLQIPGKIFNYLGAGRPILVTTESEADPLWRLLRDVRGIRFVRNRPEEIRSAMSEIFSVGVDRGDAAAYSWGIIARGLTRSLVGEPQE